MHREKSLTEPTRTKYDIDCDRVCRDLAAQGFYVISISYRLAPCGFINGQDPSHSNPLDGRPPQQTDDVKSAIRAAEADLVHVKNGKVGVLGGSAGGSHASFVLFDKIPTPGGGYPYWCLTGDNRPVCGVSLSGAYNFADRAFPDITPKFIRDVNNYTNTCVQADQLTKNGLAISPVALVKSEAEQTFMDVFLVNSEGDSMPYREILDIQCKFQEKQISTTKYKVVTTQTMSHSFQLWKDVDPQNPPTKVRGEVFQFFYDHLGKPQKK